VSRSIAEIVDEHIAAGKTTLPVFDGTTQRLQGMLQSGEFDMGAVEELITGDPVLASATLRLANSSFFAGLEKITNVREAIVRLGVKQVSNLVTIVAQKKNYHIRDRVLQPLVAALWRHSVGVAIGSQWLAGRVKRGDLSGEAFMAGMLHDIGKLLLLRVVDDLKAQGKGFDPSESLVLELLASLHARHGHALMKQWNIPEVYCDVVQRHHDADFEDGATLLILVRLVDQACNKLGIGLEPRPDLDLAASAEAQVLRVDDVLAAELEIRLEDAAELAGMA
jgi:HD-like signal output (HDOD) protein